GGSKRLLTRADVSRALQEIETARDAAEDLLGRDDGRPRRRELEREREVVELVAELHEYLGALEARIERTRSRHEQLDCFDLRERQNGVHLLAREAESFSARDDDCRPAQAENRA